MFTVFSFVWYWMLGFQVVLAHDLASTHVSFDGFIYKDPPFISPFTLHFLNVGNTKSDFLGLVSLFDVYWRSNHSSWCFLNSQKGTKICILCLLIMVLIILSIFPLRKMSLGPHTYEHEMFIFVMENFMSARFLVASFKDHVTIG